jgi:hypothetical protein
MEKQSNNQINVENKQSARLFESHFLVKICG